jgi:hypothetical protein
MLNLMLSTLVNLLVSNYMATADAKVLFPSELKPRTDQPELAL